MNNKRLEFWANVGFYGYYQLAIGIIVGIFLGEFVYTLLTNKTHPFVEMWIIGLLAFFVSFIFFDKIYKSKITIGIIDNKINIKTSQYNFTSNQVKYDQYIVFDPKKPLAKPRLQLEIRFDKNMITFSEVLFEDRELPHFKKTNLYIKYTKLPSGIINQIVSAIDEYYSNINGTCTGECVEICE